MAPKTTTAAVALALPKYWTNDRRLLDARASISPAFWMRASALLLAATLSGEPYMRSRSFRLFNMLSSAGSSAAN